MSGNTVQPVDFPTRPFHYRALQADGAQFVEYSGCAIANSFGGAAQQEAELARNLGLADLTPLPRTGFKGRKAIEWLRQAGLEIGDENNFSWRQSDGTMVARLADTEALILGSLSGAGETCNGIESRQAEEEPEGCYHVPRRNASAWFLVTGQYADLMFAKICGVDMRTSKFPSSSIAQTSMARMNAIAIRQDLGEVPAYHLVFDCASADYLWRMLKDAMLEFDGKPTGYEAVRTLIT